LVVKLPDFFAMNPKWNMPMLHPLTRDQMIDFDRSMIEGTQNGLGDAIGGLGQISASG
jgi:hypothetical protein